MFRKYLPELRKQSQDFMRPMSISDMMEDFWKNSFDFGPFKNQRFPAADISETDDMVEVKAELPGMDPKEIDVSVDNGVLTIRGEKKFEDEEKKGDYHRIERSYGSFFRSFQLPHEVDEKKVKAKYKDGVLHLTLPKSASAKPKRIEIAS